MRNLYILLSVTIILIVLLLVFAFLFFEREKHARAYYCVEARGVSAGSIKVDRYRTEDRIIYKSATFYPAATGRGIVYEKLVFDRKNNDLEKFIKQEKYFGVPGIAAYIEKGAGSTFDYLAMFQSKFSTVSSLSCPGGAPVFDNESIVTYLSFIDKYDFARGGAQSFNTVYLPSAALPPARCKVVFISLYDEYIKVDGKKTKTECLAIKAKGFPESYVWVSKKDQDIVRLKIDSRALLITRVSVFQKMPAKPPEEEGGAAYDSRDIVFPSGDITLSGTVRIPRQKNDKLPCVLLAAGDGPHDSGNAGLYADISRMLVENGYIVLRFDKRGMGRSQGKRSAFSVSGEIQDTESALDFLLNYEGVDKEKAFIVAHGEACSLLAGLDFSRFPVKGLVMLGIIRAAPLEDFQCEYFSGKIKAASRMDSAYPETLSLLEKQTLKIVTDTKKDYTFIRGKHVFLARMRELLDFNALAEFKKLSVPLIIVFGLEDRFGSLSYIRDIEKALGENELKQFSIMYFRGLGHFFKKGNTTSPEVLKKIKDWIEEVGAQVPPGEEAQGAPLTRVIMGEPASPLS